MKKLYIRCRLSDKTDFARFPEKLHPENPKLGNFWVTILVVKSALKTVFFFLFPIPECFCLKPFSDQEGTKKNIGQIGLPGPEEIGY